MKWKRFLGTLCCHKAVFLRGVTSTLNSFYATKRQPLLFFNEKCGLVTTKILLPAGFCPNDFWERKTPRTAVPSTMHLAANRATFGMEVRAYPKARFGI